MPISIDTAGAWFQCESDKYIHYFRVGPLCGRADLKATVRFAPSSATTKDGGTYIKSIGGVRCRGCTKRHCELWIST